MSRLAITPSQTVGPFFGIGLPFADGPYAVAADALGAIWIRGTVTDGAGDPVGDALIETWQADPAPGDGFRGFTRTPTDTAGRYALRTLKPGPVAGPDGAPTQAPHLVVSVFARGLLDRVVTRVYFPDEADANAADPVLKEVANEADRATLIAAPGVDGYVFDICLQGAGETVFFSI
jgi:protocatechuate 3,4-dioxygenase, alpha subunit